MTAEPNAHRLLVLDDDESVCATVAAIAGTVGFEARSTTASEDFFVLLYEWSPSHVIVDLRMPDIDGVSVLRRMATEQIQAAVIVMSGLGVRVLESAARAAAESGLTVTAVLPKPFSPKRLRDVLGRELPITAEQSRRSAPASESPAFEVSEQTLRAALSRGALTPFYQPKVACDSGEVVGFEALARWRQDEVGLIMPDRFIPLAEQSGLIVELTWQVFTAALQWFAQRFRGTGLSISLNLSARVLDEPQLLDWLVRLCEGLSLPVSQVTLEVTETSTMSDPVYMVQVLTQFRIKGFGLSIDDFGVGYSSLVYLARLPFSEMKIDKMFVLSAPVSEESQKIALAIVGLAQALGLSVTAEGVEDDWTLDFLRQIGCDNAQGYLIGRPMDGDAAEHWHQRHVQGAGGAR